MYLAFLSELFFLLKDVEDVKRKLSQKQYEKETSVGTQEKWFAIEV